MLDHFLGDVEIGDHAVAHRADRLDRAGRPAQHQLGVLADGQNLLAPVLDTVGHDRGFVQNDALALDVNQSVRGPQINGHVRGKNTCQSAQHSVSLIISRKRFYLSSFINKPYTVDRLYP